ncbi:MAG: amidohydrolase family protein [Methanolinea sp.]|nr:amidohydrolase family protein [Methanolinea sp.]
MAATSRCDLVLRDVILPGGRVSDLSVRNGVVCHVGAGLPAEEQIDCRPFTVMPAAVDMHVHMRGGPQSAKEDWGTGSRSALAGGVTLVVDQPNTLPPLTTPARVADRIREALDSSSCHFAVNGGVAPGSDLPGLWRAGVMAFGEIFAAPSSYGEGVSPGELERLLRHVGDLGGLATIHAEEAAPGQDTSLPVHHALRPPAGEARAVSEVQRLNRSSARLHFCHMSCAASVDAAGGSTVEVAPHHLFLSLGMFDAGDPQAKVNPPIRPETEVKNLWSRWDRIDAIASDHAPHTREEKAFPFDAAPSGIPGVETMVPLLVARCRGRKIPLRALMEKTSWGPSGILGILRAGFAVGERADFALYPEESGKVRVDDLHSKAGWTPYEGMDAVFPEVVVMGGRIAYQAGNFFPAAPRWFPGRGYIGTGQKKNGADTARP